jgi:chromosome segregation ATPase
MDIDLNTLEVLILTIVALAGTVVISTRLSARQSDNAFGIIKTELAEEKARSNQLATRITDLETKLNEREKQVSRLEHEISVVCKQLETLQKWQVKAQSDIEGKDRKIKDLATANAELEHQNAQLYESNKRLSIENGTFQKALALLGLDLVELRSKQDSAETNTPVAVPVAQEQTTENKPEAQEG